MLFLAVFGFSGVATWIALSEPVDRGIDSRLEREADIIRRLYPARNPAAGARMIQQRESRPAGFEYRLTGRDGRRLGGGLPAGDFVPGFQTLGIGHRPTGVAADGDGDDIEITRRLRVITAPLEGGASVTLGEDLARTRQLKVLFLRTFILTAGAALMVALGVGLSYVSRVLRRIEVIAATADSVSGEDMGARAPVRSPASADDIDRLALSVNRMLDRIASLLASVRQVSDDVAHDLRTPLAHLKQRIETALSGPPSVETYRAALEGASDKIDEVIATFEALLSIARLESASPPVMHPVDLAQVAAAVVEAFRPSAEDGGRQLVLHAPRPAMMKGERSLLTQMLANLVENALIHTPVGSTIEVLAELRGPIVRLEVEDDGPGVADPHREAIFRRFFRVEASRTTPGSGLGMSLAAAVAHAHSGQIRAEDAAPGLRVVAEFPAVEETVAA